MPKSNLIDAEFLVGKGYMARMASAPFGLMYYVKNLGGYSIIFREKAFVNSDPIDEYGYAGNDFWGYEETDIRKIFEVFMTAEAPVETSGFLPFNLPVKVTIKTDLKKSNLELIEENFEYLFNKLTRKEEPEKKKPEKKKENKKTSTKTINPDEYSSGNWEQAIDVDSAWTNTGTTGS